MLQQHTLRFVWSALNASNKPQDMKDIYVLVAVGAAARELTMGRNGGPDLPLSHSERVSTVLGRGVKEGEG